MAPVPIPPMPGGMTVPPLFGWEDILAALMLLVVLAVAFLVISATGTDPDGRSEWLAGLDARSRRRGEPDDRAAEPERPEPDQGCPTPQGTVVSEGRPGT